MRRDILTIVITALLIKIIYFGFSICVYDITDKKSFKPDYTGLISTMKKNDAYWYEKIALYGYPVVDDRSDLGFHDGKDFKQSEWAFFPFYPLAAKYTSRITGLSLDSSFFGLSLIFSLLCFILFYLFAGNYYQDQEKALFYTLIIMTLPFHFYFSVFYTESVFFFFLIGVFLALLRKRFGLVSFLLIPLTLIRPNGIVLLAPLYLFMLENEGLLNKYKFDLKGIFSKDNILRSLSFLTAPIVFILYGFYQQSMTGEFFAFSIAQQGWYRDFMFPVLSFFRHGDVATQFNSVYSIIFILIAIYSWKRFPLSLNVFIWFSLILPLTSGSVLSMQRFISLIFPFTIIFGDWLFKLKFKYAAIAILFLLQLVSYYFWLTDQPVSY